MNKQEIFDYIDKIDDKTEYNDHSGALLLASELLDKLQKSGKTNRTKKLEHIKELHLLYGELTEPLSVMREDLRPWVRNSLKVALLSHGFAFGYDI